MKICHNTVILGGCACIAVVAVASIAYGHNHVIEAFGAISAMSTFVPPIADRLRKNPEQQ